MLTIAPITRTVAMSATDKSPILRLNQFGSMQAPRPSHEPSRFGAMWLKPLAPQQQSGFALPGTTLKPRAKKLPLAKGGGGLNENAPEPNFIREPL